MYVIMTARQAANTDATSDALWPLWVTHPCPWRFISSSTIQSRPEPFFNSISDVGETLFRRYFGTFGIVAGGDKSVRWHREPPRGSFPRPAALRPWLSCERSRSLKAKHTPRISKERRVTGLGVRVAAVFEGITPSLAADPERPLCLLIPVFIRPLPILTPTRHDCLLHHTGS